jgi:hypothetical protein
MKKIILSAFLFSVFANSFGQEQKPKTAITGLNEPQFLTKVEGIKEYSLPNGLKIILRCSDNYLYFLLIFIEWKSLQEKVF